MHGVWSSLRIESVDIDRISFYDIPMTIHVTPEQLDQWVKEAEEGYDVDELKKRGRGRPGRGAIPSQVVGVRLTSEEVGALDELAAKRELSRSEVIRLALSKLEAS